METDFFSYLLETFGYDSPIFSPSLVFGNYSRPWIAKELALLCEEGKIKRFERGIYFIPSSDAPLDPYRVIEYKYIGDKDNVIGYFSGPATREQFGLPNGEQEFPLVVTNAECSRLRLVNVGPLEIHVRRGRTLISNDNIVILSFFDMLSEFPDELLDDAAKEAICHFVSENRIKRSQIMEYAALYPKRTLSNLILSGAIYCAIED